MNREVILYDLPLEAGNFNTHVRVRIYYHDGESYTQKRARGLYLSVQPIQVEKLGSGLTRVGFQGYSGVYELVEELTRFSKKKLENCQVNEKRIEEMIEHVCKKAGAKLALPFDQLIFVEVWGQTHEEVCMALGYDEEDADDLLIDYYIWIPEVAKWIPESDSSSYFTEEEREMAESLKHR